MELILISKSKLKIMLDERDMLEYHINDETDCAELKAREAIRSILDRARDEVGFETEGSEIFIQLYTSKKGGCELFVSKNKLPALPERASAKGIDEGKKKNAPTKMAFSFPSANELIAVCRKLKRIKAPYRSAAFADGDGRAYLMLYNVGQSLYSRLDKLTFILEFGNRENPGTLSSYIDERCKTICADGAIEVLSRF